MRKETAIELLGGTTVDAARAIGITPSAISQWPDVLSRRVEDRVLAAIARREWKKTSGDGPGTSQTRDQSEKERADA